MLILSYFDPIRGPIILLYTPESVDEDDIKMIPSLMDNYEKGFFIHIYEGFKCANYVFEIHSPYARGNKEIFLISKKLRI